MVQIPYNIERIPWAYLCMLSILVVLSALHIFAWWQNLVGLPFQKKGRANPQCRASNFRSPMSHKSNFSSSLYAKNAQNNWFTFPHNNEQPLFFVTLKIEKMYFVAPFPWNNVTWLCLSLDEYLNVILIIIDCALQRIDACTLNIIII